MKTYEQDEYCIDCTPKQRAVLEKLREKQERVDSWESQLALN